MEGRVYETLWYFWVFPDDVLCLLRIIIKLELAFIFYNFTEYAVSPILSFTVPLSV